jgi:hypothetical protein
VFVIEYVFVLVSRLPLELGWRTGICACGEGGCTSTNAYSREGRVPRPPLGRGAAQGIAAGQHACINLLPEAPCVASAGSCSRGATAFSSRMRGYVAVDSRIAASGVCSPMRGLRC